ncbi:MAG: LytR/AlgR family response regulator transcription factor, partial [Terriglobales bacterium]
AQNAAEAEALLEQLKPDVVFLDVQMPGRSGFDLIEGRSDLPAVIFTTAYDQYALRAFEASAIDYLLKPIAPPRLAAALQRLQTWAATAPAQPAPLPAHRQIFVRDGERCWFLRLRDIVLLESEGNYTRLLLAADPSRPLVPRSLNYLEERLDPALFFRTSRQHIVNIECIEKLDPWVNGGLHAKLRGGRAIEISRRQALKFQEKMKL